MIDYMIDSWIIIWKCMIFGSVDRLFDLLFMSEF